MLRDEIIKELYEINEETGHDGIKEIADAILALVEKPCEWKTKGGWPMVGCTGKLYGYPIHGEYCPYCGKKIAYTGLGRVG